ncbi:MAG: class I SAM-dependent methyltransferase [Clostridia bacterium]|nr:class I SAM-dependent methyltransferase [Clostridia bacterium]
MDIFFEIHQDIPREGPGSNETTRKVFSMIHEFPEIPRILDVGCGPGMQTIELAKSTQGDIIALDFHQPFLDVLNKNIQKERLTDKVKTVHGSMFDLPFEKESFNMIWSEGAIYIMGFEKGLKEWKKFLKRNGIIAVSEISWLKSTVPEEPLKFWQEAYPGIRSVNENLKIMDTCGYDTIGLYILPESDWWDGYYAPLTKRIERLQEKYKGNREAEKLLNDETKEIEIFKKYSSYYSYAFYIMQAK